jgi:hypothetical protein
VISKNPKIGNPRLSEQTSWNPSPGKENLYSPNSLNLNPVKWNPWKLNPSNPSLSNLSFGNQNLYILNYAKLNRGMSNSGNRNPVKRNSPNLNHAKIAGWQHRDWRRNFGTQCHGQVAVPENPILGNPLMRIDWNPLWKYLKRPF